MSIREVRESIKKDYVMIFIEDMYGNQLAYLKCDRRCTYGKKDK